MRDFFRYTGVFCFVLALFFIGPASGVSDATNTSTVKDPVLLWSMPIDCREYCYSWPGGHTSISYDGEQVALGYGPGIIEIRDRQGETTGRWQTNHRYYTIWSVSISRDGSRVVAVLNDETQQHEASVIYLDNQGRLIWERSLEGPFGFADISDDGGIVTVSDGDRINFYNRDGNRTGTKVLEGMIWHMQLAGDGSYAVAGVTPRDFSGNLYLISNNGTTAWYSTTEHRPGAVAISDDGMYLAGSSDGQLRFFSQNGTRIWKFNGSTETRSLAISSAGKNVVAGSQYYLRYFNKDGKILWHYEDPVISSRQGAYFSNLAITDNGEYVATTTRDNKTLLFNNKGKIVEEIKTPLWVTAMRMSGSGNAIVIGTREEIRYFDTGIPQATDTKPTPVTTNAPVSTTIPPTTQKSPLSVMDILMCLSTAIFLTAQSGKR